MLHLATLAPGRERSGRAMAAQGSLNQDHLKSLAATFSGVCFTRETMGMRKPGGSTTV
jgi:hypothetical protein